MSRTTGNKTLYASRGSIYDLNGEILAENVNSYTDDPSPTETSVTTPTIKNKTNNTGKIEIEYYSMDELERIVELMDSLQ